MAFLQARRSQSLVFLIVALLLTLTACASNNGGSSSSKNSKNSANNASNVSSVKSSSMNGASNKNIVNNTSKNTTTTTNKTNSTSGSSAPITIVVGGEQDTEAQLLTKMYALLLRHAGFTVIEQANAGTDDVVFNAMISGHLDLSPAFTATGLNKLGLQSTGIAQLDYLQMKQGYEAKYHMTWLDPAPLNAKVYDSAPIVRDSILKKAPLIAITLNKLAPILTVQATQQLQSEFVKNGQNVTEVATLFLQSKGLI
jgi:glycine betaine/choline ABC-type transport system substrate-binding protein